MEMPQKVEPETSTSPTYNNVWCYDLECILNFFSATFVNAQTGEEKIFWAHKESSNIHLLLEFLKEGYDETRYFVGYNSSRYDNLLLSHFLMNVYNWNCVDELIASLHNLSQEIIQSQGLNYYNEYHTILRKNKLPFISLDLLTYYEKTEKKSLKQSLINAKWYWIQDMPVGIEDDIPVSSIETILAYNMNDVKGTEHLLKTTFWEIIAHRFGCSAKFGVNVLNANKSKTADVLLAKFYEQFSGISYWDFKDLRTHHNSIKVRDCISPKVKFITPELNSLLDYYRNAVIIDTRKELKKRIKFGGTTYNLGAGGLHSEDLPGVFRATKELIIRDADVTSYYPFLVLNERFKPRHTTDAIFDVVRMIITDRVAAKKAGDTITADALKIVANSGGFGKMGFEMHWMYDRKGMVSVTINGQMFLLMLIERLTLAGFQVISANTDGIVTLIDSTKEKEYFMICDMWSNELSYNLEYTDYSDYIRRDVNNYTTKTIKDKFKERGCFRREIDVVKGYNTKVIAHALHEYYFNNIPIKDSIYKHTDILDFCLSEKSGDGWKNVYRFINQEDGCLAERFLQKNVRFYISTKGGSLIKKHRGGREIGLCAGKYATVYNYHEERPIQSYNIDYNYYIAECNKIVNSISCNVPGSKKTKLKKELEQSKFNFDV